MTTMAIMFDTLKFAESLKKSGMPDEQANALTEAQREVFAEVMDNKLATKSDIERVDASIRKLDKRVSILEAELKLLKWLLGIVIAGVGALVLKAFF